MQAQLEFLQIRLDIQKNLNLDNPQFHNIKNNKEIWNNDDSLRFHTILNHPSDNDLSLHYSKRSKKTIAKRLWRELNSRFGGRKSRVRKDMECHLLEEKPMVKQVEEMNSRFKDLLSFHKMADI